MQCFDSSQGSSERVRYFAERVLNVRSDQQIKNAFGTPNVNRPAGNNPVSLYLLSCRRLCEGAEELIDKQCSE